MWSHYSSKKSLKSQKFYVNILNSFHFQKIENCQAEFRPLCNKILQSHFSSPKTNNLAWVRKKNILSVHVERSLQRLTFFSMHYCQNYKTLSKNMRVLILINCALTVQILGLNPLLVKLKCTCHVRIRKYSHI